MEAGLSKTGSRWVLGALIAALASFAYAKSSGVPHGGGGFHGGPSVFAYPHTNGSSGHFNRYAARGREVQPAQPRARRNDETMSRAVQRDNRQSPQRMQALTGDVYRNDRPSTLYAGSQFAGSITPISTETRSAPRPPANPQSIHTGSIRDDVARYNEERGAARMIPHPPSDTPRPPGNSGYRN